MNTVSKKSNYLLENFSKNINSQLGVVTDVKENLKNAKIMDICVNVLKKMNGEFVTLVSI